MLGLKPLTGAAFSAARYKIQSGFFQELNNLLIDHIQNLKPQFWKGYRLIAGDGSSVLLPASPKIKEEFGIFSSTDKGTITCLAQVIMFYDVLSNYVLGTKLGKMDKGEKSLFKELLPEIEVKNAIFLLDRGFGNISICKLLQKHRHKYCIRVSTQISNFAKRVMADARQDFITTWTPSEEEELNCKKNKVDTKPIQVRVTKVILNTGETELIISDLFNFEQITQEDIGDLYFKRWGIEEGYKKLKPKMKLEHFGCKKPEGICQEYYAHIFMMNLVTIIGNEAQQEVDIKTEKRKHKYKYNWQNAFRHVRDKIVQLINGFDIRNILNDLFTLIAKSPVAIKPNRSFSREKHKSDKARLHPCYK